MTAPHPRQRRRRAMAPLARLPVFLALGGKRAVLAGGSAAAAWKAELLSAAGAQVEVYATRLVRRNAGRWRDPPRGSIALHRRALDRGRSERRRDRGRRVRRRRGCRRLRRRRARRRRAGQRHRQAGVLRFLLRRYRQPLAAGDRHLDRRRRAGVRAGDPRQARSAAAARLRRLGRRRRALALRR